MVKSQSVLDALADAETLRLNAHEAVMWADVYGSDAARRSRKGYDITAADRARKAARAAFRAIPGLRGE